ncbi:MAG: hypothetical protein CMI16_07065 [Opitutaceae bacterium]|nr:hypothetical protein [Opitutaceae bacterium]
MPAAPVSGRRTSVHRARHQLHGDHGSPLEDVGGVDLPRPHGVVVGHAAFSPDEAVLDALLHELAGGGVLLRVEDLRAALAVLVGHSGEGAVHLDRHGGRVGLAGDGFAGFRVLLRSGQVAVRAFQRELRVVLRLALHQLLGAHALHLLHDLLQRAVLVLRIGLPAGLDLLRDAALQPVARLGDARVQHFRHELRLLRVLEGDVEGHPLQPELHGRVLEVGAVHRTRRAGQVHPRQRADLLARPLAPFGQFHAAGELAE